MSALALLDELRRRGVEIGAEGDRLRLHVPAGALDDTLRDRLVTNKQSILELLRARSAPSRLEPDPVHAHEPFPLTDIQQAYWIGRSADLEIGNIGTHTYLEFERAELDPQRLSAAWRRVVDRHPMLRAVVRADGTQQVLATVPAYEIAVDDMRDLVEAEGLAQVDATRARLSHQLFDDAVWPLFELRVTALPGRYRVHVSGEVLVADARSWQVIFRDWGRLYDDPVAQLEPLELTFRDYVLAEPAAHDPAARTGAERYWRERARDLPPGPELPLALQPAEIVEPRFTRHCCRIDRLTWERLKRSAAAQGLTPSVALLTAYAAVLGDWSRHPRFTLNLTLFNRLALHPQIGEIVGDFTSFTLLDVDLEVGTIGELAAKLQSQLHERMEHTALSGVEALRVINRERGSAATAASAPVVFTSLVNSSGDMMKPFEWLGSMTHSITQTSQVWLDHQVFEDDGDLVVNWDVVDGLLEVGVVEGMLAAYEGLVRGLAGVDGWGVGVGDVLGDGRAGRVAFNATDGVVADGLLQSGFLEWAAMRPDAVAVIGERVLSYGELERRSAAVAACLVRGGVGAGSLVAVVMDKGWEQVVGVLGVLRAGAGYVPVDPQWPAGRREVIFEQCDVSVALTQSWLSKSLSWPEGVGSLAVDELAPLVGDGDAIDVAGDGGRLAYVIFTSGSTGRPKGVAIDHRGALNTVTDVNRRYGLCREDRVLGISALSFDLSVWDIFGTLTAGGALVLPDAGAVRDPAHWCELLVEHDVTVWNSAPALMSLVVEYAEALPGALGQRLRLVMLSGDWIAVTLPDRVRALTDGVRVVSLGGATEASIWSIAYDIEDVDECWRSIPYGRPLANQHVYVLDHRLRERPDWAIGEIYIGGAGVSIGYHADAQRTAERFIAHPDSGERLYRTGDLGRQLPDGVIEFLGREDFQVKIQGYRIELEEIEAVLLEHHAVSQAVVSAHGPRDGTRTLAAHIVTHQPPDDDLTQDLRAHAATHLPTYMLPNTITILDALPLTPNGKIDRNALTTPTTPTGAAGADEAMDVVERQILQLVCDVLARPDVGRGDDLMRLGATSLHMVRLANALEARFGTRPTLSEFLHRTTVTALAGLYDEHRAATERIDGTGAPGAPARSLPRVLTEPGQRERFKATRPGLRTPADGARVPLADVAPGQPSLRERRSCRRFDAGPVMFDALSGLLAAIRQRQHPDGPRSNYPSAGGLFAVQVHVDVKEGRVGGVSPGAYCYRPDEHALHALAPGGQLRRDAHAPFNRDCHDDAAFTLMLVGELAAIEPLYGEMADDFALLEAGYLSQLLMMTASSHGLGICPIGTIDVVAVGGRLRLGSSQRLLHTLLVGPLPGRQFPDDDHLWEEGEL